MYYAAQYLTTDASRLRKAMEEYHKFIIYEYNKQEPASEDLEREIEMFFKDWYFDDTMSILAKPNYNFCTCEDLKDVAKHFAQWQKEQMMKDAIETTIDGKVVKVIVIDE